MILILLFFIFCRLHHDRYRSGTNSSSSTSSDMKSERSGVSSPLSSSHDDDDLDFADNPDLGSDSEEEIDPGCHEDEIKLPAISVTRATPLKSSTGAPSTIPPLLSSTPVQLPSKPVLSQSDCQKIILNNEKIIEKLMSSATTGTKLSNAYKNNNMPSSLSNYMMPIPMMSQNLLLKPAPPAMIPIDLSSHVTKT